MPNASDDWHPVDTIPVEKPSEVLTVTGIVCVARPRPFRDATRYIREAGRYGPRRVACVRTDERSGSDVMAIGWRPLPSKVKFLYKGDVSGLRREIGEILECRISGRKVFLKRVEGHYDYDKDRATCPMCGSLGMPWSGMYHCEGNEKHKAIVPTGQCFRVYYRRPVVDESSERR